MTDVETFGGQCCPWDTVCNLWSECGVADTFGGEWCTWDTVCHLWDECGGNVVDIIEDERSNIGVPQDWEDLYNKDLELETYQQEQLQKNKRLIEIYVNCFNIKYNKIIVVSEKKAKITVQDVGFILKTTLNEVVVDVKNIKKYTDSVVIKVVNITKN